MRNRILLIALLVTLAAAAWWLLGSGAPDPGSVVPAASTAGQQRDLPDPARLDGGVLIDEPAADPVGDALQRETIEAGREAEGLPTTFFRGRLLV
ncbi:MAG: hypothetical protein O3A20_10970, partial [Planctomycetota bacterium]|nr:hypothetical protein [Planctomycetota bacterium]